MAQDPLHLLCVEPRFPGRLGAVADWLVRKRGYRCWFFCAGADGPEHWPGSAGKGLDVFQFGLGAAAREAAVSWTRCLERGLCYAYGCWEVLEARRPRPIDLVLGRSAGLGSTLFVPASLPRVPVVNLFDYFYHPHAHDLAGEAPPDIAAGYYHWRRAANAIDLLDLENGGKAWVPTRWQRDLYPPEYRDDFLVLHDGVDVGRFAARPGRPRTLAGRTVPAGTRVVTFVARHLDRLRGFDRFVALANRLLRRYPDLVCVVVGGTPVQRGLDIAFFNKDYRDHVLGQTPPYDPGRFWLLDAVSQTALADVLAVADLHVYPSRPYAVSLSLLEAMAAGRVVLAGDTGPVREILADGQTGLLTSPDDLDEWERKACAVLEDRAAYGPLGEAAAVLVRERYAHDVTLPQLAARFDEWAG